MRLAIKTDAGSTSSGERAQITLSPECGHCLCMINRGYFAPRLFGVESLSYDQVNPDVKCTDVRCEDHWPGGCKTASSASVQTLA